MMTATIVMVTFPQALRQAVDSCRIAFEEAALTRDQLSSGEVYAALQNVCVDIGLVLRLTPEGTNSANKITYRALPRPLRDLYMDAQKRSLRDREPNRSLNYKVNFNLSGLLRTINDSLAQIH